MSERILSGWEERECWQGWEGRERARESAHVCITFMCTCACQTSQCVRPGTPVMLTGSDSPRPDQQALAQCMAWALLCGKRAQLRGRSHSLCHSPGQRGRSGPGERAKEGWGRLCECVFHSWLVYQSLPAAAVASGTALCSLSPPSPSIAHTPSSPTYHSLLPWLLPLPASCRCLPGLCAFSLPSHSVLTARLLQSLCPHCLQIHANTSQQ